MSQDERIRWDRRYVEDDRVPDPGKPAEIVRDAEPWLEPPGTALDLACGAGRNAAWLARRGYRVLAVDLSIEGLARLARRVREADLPVQPVQADLADWPVAGARFDLVVNSHFLLRSTFPLVRGALKPGGLLLFETFSVDEIDLLGGDIRRRYALEHGELRKAFGGFELLLYQEGIFDRPEGERGLARLIARKPGR